MKRVLFVMNNMNIGGTEKAFLNMVDEMSPEEYNVTLLLLDKSGGFLTMVPEWVNIEVIDGYDTMKSKIMDPPLQVAFKYLRQKNFWKSFGIAFTHIWYKLTDDRTLYFRYVLKGKQKKESYDTAIAYCGPFDFITVYVLYCISAAMKIQWIHFDVSKFQFNTKMCKKLYQKFQKIYVVSDEARTELVKKIPEINAKTETFFNRVSRHQCQELAKQGKGFKDEYNGIRIITVGRLAEEKGQDIIPEVARKLVDSEIDFRWYLVGDGKLRSDIEKKIQKNNVSEYIIFLGTQPNPYQYLKDADIYVQTSKHEGYCITLAEARAFDLPIVSTECAGAHDQLDGRAMSYVVKRDAEDIYKAIIELMNAC